MNVTIKNQTHASTNPYKTVCGLSLGKRSKTTGNLVTCEVCKTREEKRFKEIQDYVQKLLENEGLDLQSKMWRLVGYVEGGLR